MTHSKLASRTQWTHQKSSRDGAKIDRFIVHHAATTSLDTILRLFAGAREVSANYALGDGTIVATVPEEERAWTSASYEDDRRAVTVEVANSKAADPWPVADREFDNLARLIADVATRHSFPITDDAVLTHQELYSRFGRSYATACPGDLQRRKSELLTLARSYQGKPAKPAPAPKPTTKPTPKPYAGEQVAGVLGWNPFGIPYTGGLQKVARLYGYRGALDQIWGAGSMSGFAQFLRANHGYVGNDELGPVMWRAIQRWLKAKWGYTGEIDGIPGTGTRTALLRADTANWAEL